MEISTAILLVLSAFFTSIISATVGMAGGTVLLSIMLFFLPAAGAIPLHAANQLISNASRSWLLRSHIRWDFFTPFAFAAIIGNVASTWLLKTTVDLRHAPLLISIIILYSVFKPRRLPNIHPKRAGFFIVGLVIGFLGMFIGATGLILGTCFVRDDMKKEEILATQGAMQSFNHFTKILGFLWLGFDYIPWLIPLGLMMIATTLGTKYGVSLIKHISEQLFKTVFRGILVVSAIHLLWQWTTNIFG